MNINDYSTAELVDALEDQSCRVPKDDIVYDLMKVAAIRLRQYHWMDVQRIRDVFKTVKQPHG